MASGSGTSGRMVKAFLGKSRTVRIGLAVVLIVALVGVGLAQLYPLLDRKSTLQSAETTTGTVTKAEYPQNRYEIRYEYTVDGQTYESTRVFPAPYAPRGTGEKRAVPLFDAGEQTTVHYDPNEPGYAWLTTRGYLVSRHVVYFAALGFVAVLLAAYLYVELKWPKLAERDDGAQGHAPGGAEAMLAAMAEMDSETPPSQAEMLDRMSEQLPEEVVEQIRTADGQLDPSRLDDDLGQYAATGRPSGQDATAGRPSGQDATAGQRPEQHSAGQNPGQQAAPGQRSGQHSTGRQGGGSGLFGSLGKLLGLLKGVGLVVLTGGLLVLGASVVFTQILTP